MQKNRHSSSDIFSHQINKKSLRSVYNKKVKDISAFSKKTKQKNLIHILKKLPFWEAAVSIAVYKALKDELCLSDFYKLWKDKICFPVIQNEKLCFYKNTKSQWKKNQFQILEPVLESQNYVPLKDISVFLIPGRAFDRQGGRLGRGYGYYDKTLKGLKRKVKNVSKIKSPILVGVSFAEQIYEDFLPLQLHDVCMDIVVTDRFAFIPLSKKRIFSKFNKKER